MISEESYVLLKNVAFLVEQIDEKLEQIDSYDQANRQWWGCIQAELAKHQKLEKEIEHTVASRTTTKQGTSEKKLIKDTANPTPGPSLTKTASAVNADYNCTIPNYKVCFFRELGQNFAAKVEEEIDSCVEGQILTCRNKNIIYVLIFPCGGTYGK